MNGDDPVRGGKEDGYQEKTTMMAFLISLGSAGVSLSSTIEFNLLCFCSSQKLYPVERKSQMKGSTEALDQNINPIWCSLLT